MSSLGNEAQKEEVITRAESQLDQLAQHCDVAMSMYRQVEELEPILREVEHETQCMEKHRGSVPVDLVAFRDRLRTDRDSYLAQAAEAEGRARACERQSVAALHGARSSPVREAPQAS